MDDYLSDKISDEDFCDRFYWLYDLENGNDKYSAEEEAILSELSVVAGRYSPNYMDHLLYPKAYFTTEQLRSKVKDIMVILCN